MILESHCFELLKKLNQLIMNKADDTVLPPVLNELRGQRPAAFAELAVEIVCCQGECALLPGRIRTDK